MNMLKKFNYIAPNNIIKALKILESEGTNAVLMAGGTDLLTKIRQGSISPKIVIGLKKIKELNILSLDPNKGLTIGATVLLSTIVKHIDILKNYPTIALSASLTANPQVRNMGTIVGNICNASPSADNSPILLAMNTFVNITNSTGESKKVPLDQFFIAPGVTTLAKNEIVTSIFIPKPPKQYGTSYLSIAQRSKIGCTAVGVSTMLTIDKNNFTSIRLFIGACGPTPIRASKTEQTLLNQSFKNKKLIKKASMEAPEEISPITDVRASANYRKKMVSILTIRALENAKNMAIKNL